MYIITVYILYDYILHTHHEKHYVENQLMLIYFDDYNEKWNMLFCRTFSSLSGSALKTEIISFTAYFQLHIKI